MKYFWIIRGLTAISIVFAYESSALAKTLEMPPPSSSLETIYPHIVSMVRKKDKLLLFAPRVNYVIEQPFYGAKSTRAESFGTFKDAKRLPLPLGLNNPESSFALNFGEHYLVLDGQSLELARMSQTMPRTPDLDSKLELSLNRSMALDMIKPPSDSRGEPTHKETISSRKKFLNSLKATSGLKFSGITSTPPKWWSGKSTRYLIASQIEGFPLLSLSCDPIDITQCILDRFCLMNQHIGVRSLVGIAVSTKRNLLLLGDKDAHAIQVYEFHSCFDIRRKTSISLPKRIKALSYVYVDEEDSLWVASSRPDDYDNASVFRWSSKEW